MPLCVSLCICFYSCHPLSSQCCLHKTNQPHKSKELTETFFIWLKDYIIWFSVCCVHILAHTNLVADGRKHHTCAHHTLTVSFLLTQTCFEPVQTDCAHTSIHRHTLSGDTTPTLVGKLDPQCPEALTERHRKRSVDPMMCVVYTPNSHSSLSRSLSFYLSLCLHLPFPQF